MAKHTKAVLRRRRHHRLRRSLSGTPERPRLNVYRSLRHTYAQVIDDTTGRVLVAASTRAPELQGAGGGNVAAAERIGTAIAERALAAGVAQVVFDRGGWKYHGRVKALADAARKAGLAL